MKQLKYNDETALEYEYIRIVGSGTPLNSTRYFTKVYLLSGTGKYQIGELDGEATEEEIKASFRDVVETSVDRKYGTQRPLLRRDLKPIRQR